MNIPDDLQIIDKSLLDTSSKPDAAKSFDIFINDGLEWPSNEYISINKVESPIINILKKEPIEFIQVLLKNDWIADDLEERLMGIKKGMDGFDSFLARYEKDGHYIQIAFKMHRLEIILSRKDGQPFSNKSMLDNVLKCMEIFLKDFNIVRSIEWEIVEFDNFAIGYQIRKKFPMTWDGTLSWLTNGRAVRLRMKPILKPKIVKSEGGREKQQNWFGEIGEEGTAIV